MSWAENVGRRSPQVQKLSCAAAWPSGRHAGDPACTELDHSALLLACESFRLQACAMPSTGQAKPTQIQQNMIGAGRRSDRPRRHRLSHVTSAPASVRTLNEVQPATTSAGSVQWPCAPLLFRNFSRLHSVRVHWWSVAAKNSCQHPSSRLYLCRLPRSNPSRSRRRLHPHRPPTVRPPPTSSTLSLIHI